MEAFGYRALIFLQNPPGFLPLKVNYIILGYLQSEY